MSSEQMSAIELAAYLNLPRETVYKYVRAGRLPAIKSGRTWAFDRAQIDRWIDANVHHGEPAARAAVLVVDDEPAVRHVFKVWLENAGYKVDEAADGQQALGRLDAAAYGLVFLDLQMPNMDGVETLRHIRNRAEHPDVIIVTAHYNGALMEEILKLGPVHVLKKPVDRERFLEAAAKYAS
jgi:excisionase family DNA binding protein